MVQILNQNYSVVFLKSFLLSTPSKINTNLYEENFWDHSKKVKNQPYCVNDVIDCSIKGV
jgi:hypothetical protein